MFMVPSKQSEKKADRKLARAERRNLDENLKALKVALAGLHSPKSWVKSIRESLGMSSRALAQRIGIQQSAVIFLEQRESEGKATVETLQKAAAAMGCEFVYAFLPKKSLEETLSDEATKAATRIFQTELSELSEDEKLKREKLKQYLIEEIANELKSKLDPKIWA